MIPIERGAEISDCGEYRYALWRRWDKTRPRLIWIMLNPSTADAETDDPTIRVCMGRARLMGFGGIRVLNLFNYRATDPAELVEIADPVGPDGDRALSRYAGISGEMMIAGWGTHGTLKGYTRPRNREVMETLCFDLGIALHALRLTKDGHPCHPLRIPYSTKPRLWLNRERWLTMRVTPPTLTDA